MLLYVCTAVVPVLDAVNPNYGVVAGGTFVTINGTYEDRISPVAVYFGGFESTHIVAIMDMSV